MDMHSFMAMPPTVIHRVRNNSSEYPFVFLIVQTPRPSVTLSPDDISGRSFDLQRCLLLVVSKCTEEYSRTRIGEDRRGRDCE
jgi:hypothetical protein